jgi:hypothetical protein
MVLRDSPKDMSLLAINVMKAIWQVTSIVLVRFLAISSERGLIFFSVLFDKILYYSTSNQLITYSFACCLA